MSHEIRDGDVVAFMSRHFVALTCHYNLSKPDGTTDHHVPVISGFLLELHGVFFWVTAGHCLKYLDKLLASEGVQVYGGSFMDGFGYGAVHKHALPFRYETGCGYYVTQLEHGIDFGLIALNGLQIRAFQANKVIAITRENWLHQRGLTFDFYKMRGIPKDRVIKSAGPDGTISVNVGPLMVHVNRIGLDDLGEAPSDAEAAPSDAWFLGQLPFECPIQVMEGMSGGPIYGFRHDDKGRLSYHVVALQSRWWDRRRIGIRLLGTFVRRGSVSAVGCID
ncbi:MAG: hypothetical protein ABSF26_05480 [Thermoguttaceae bacterium]|jgi:hypothetical protein